MTKSNITEYDNTAANNTDVEDVPLGESAMFPSHVNNAFREIMADLADINDGTVAMTSPSFASASVAGVLTVTGSTGYPVLNLQPSSASNASQLRFGLSSDADHGQISYTNSSGTMKLRADNTDTVTITGTGAKIGGSTNISMDSVSDGQIMAQGNGYTGSIALDGTAMHLYHNSSIRSLVFGINETEKARLDTSGNWLVGKSSASISTVGSEIRADGLVVVGRDAGIPLLVNRLTDEGILASFRKDGTVIGSIYCDGTNDIGMYSAAGSHVGIRLGQGYYLPTNNGGSLLDNVVDIGISSYRYDNIYATNGTIQTSDQNEKQQIASLTDAEITAAKAISKLFKTFKWNERVEEKGDDARTHAGVIAQDVQQAMTDAGLDVTKYAFWCSDTWWEKQTEVPAVEAVAAQDAVIDEDSHTVISEAVEEVEAQDAYTKATFYLTEEDAPEGATKHTRLGIRYPELLAFIGAATEQRLTDIETRLTALET